MPFTSLIDDKIFEETTIFDFRISTAAPVVKTNNTNKEVLNFFRKMEQDRTRIKINIERAFEVTHESCYSKKKTKKTLWK